MKRIIDFVAAILLIIILFPLMLLTSVAIMLDSKGGIFFLQERVGRNGKVFRIYKFRTMVKDAEHMGSKLDSYKGDPRVTKLGQILRKTSIDELPQLFNIVMGDMSFVGPRPPVTYHPCRYEEYDDAVKVRFSIRPGLTGYAQINGRNELTWDAKFQYDLYYVENIKFLFDLRIVCESFWKVFKMEGNYDVPKDRREKETV